MCKTGAWTSGWIPISASETKIKNYIQAHEKRRIIHVLSNISEHILHVFTFVLWNVLQHV